jgi:hypothetical protein
VDLKHILIYEPSNGYATYYAKKVDEPNTSISVNFYSLRKIYDGNSSRLKEAFDDLYNPVKTWGVPFILGEVGIESSQPNFALWTNDTLSMVSQYGLSWMWFVYGKSNLPDFCILHSDGTEKEELTAMIKLYL